MSIRRRGMRGIRDVASGVPVLISNFASMPEVAGGFAEEVDPLDIDSITRGLNNLLGDLDTASQRCEAARQQSGDFCWRKAADSIIDVASGLHKSV